MITVGQMPVPAQGRMDRAAWRGPGDYFRAGAHATKFRKRIGIGDASPHVGDEVFAIGNPHGLGWTHSAGDISQIRRQKHGDYDFRVLQTTAAINPGNSGGGLYDCRRPAHRHQHDDQRQALCRRAWLFDLAADVLGFGAGAAGFAEEESEGGE